MKTEHQNLLLSIARDAIVHGLEKSAMTLPAELPAELIEHHASFVTLKINDQLRGCIGMLEACRPLAADVAKNAFAAAFNDPRFQPLSREELKELEIHISILSAPVEMTFSSESDLLEQIRPGVDGLILMEGSFSGTFLPSVWNELIEKTEFLAELKAKAGLPRSYWSDRIRVFRYTTECFEGTIEGRPA